MRFPPASRLALLAALALTATPTLATAQRTEGRNLRIAFESGSASRNGYADAQAEVTYHFGRCADRVAFLASYNPVPHMLVGNHRYWFNGRMMEVPPHIAPPRLESPTIRGTVRGNGIAREINYLYATSGSPSCLTNDAAIGMTSEFWPASTPEERRLAILNGFGFDQRGTLPPLRNSAAEAYFSQVLSAAREDSLARARQAEQARLAARRDSITRAQAARARQDSLARAEQQRRADQQRASSSTAGAAGSTGAATGGAVASSGGTASSTAGGAGTQPSAQDRAEAERRAAEQAAAERAEADARAAAAVEEVRRRQEAEAERQRQIEAATVATAVAAVAIVGGIMEARRAAVERRRVREAQRQREADARYAAYVATTRARYEAAPPQPVCTLANVRDTVTLTMATQTRRVNLSASDCRLEGGQSAEMLLLELDVDAPVILSSSSSPLLNQLFLLDATTGRGVTSASEYGIAFNLPRGRYVLVASSRLPGEEGDIALGLRKGWIADAQGSVGGAGAGAKTINGFVGTNTTSTSWMDLSYGLQFRRWMPYLTFSTMLATDSEAQEWSFDVGLRQYIARADARVKPYVEAGLGMRSVSVRQEPFTTVSPAFGAGITWHMTPGFGLLLGATQITGKARNTDDIWTSPPPDVPLGRTIFRLGMMIY